MDRRKCSGLDVSSGQPVEIEFDASIRAVEPLFPPAEAANWLAPGFIDIQVNGFAGVDYCSPHASLEDIARSLKAQFATGVTRLFPTVITGSVENMAGAIRNLTKARSALAEGRAMEGLHIEGPHISPEDGPRGAHPKDFVRPPDMEEFKRWMDLSEGHIKLVTVSPEWPGITSYIEEAVRQGVVVSIGHTKATKAQIHDAVLAGATMSTHLGNGAHSLLRRHPNYIWDQLAEDRLTASFIVDGIHLDESFLKVALRAKGVERSVLITDAVMPAGCAPGRYRLGEVEVELHPDHRVTLVDSDRLAGSSLHMNRGIENLTRLAGLSLREAVAMATRNPARAGRIPSRLRGLQPGDRADIVEFAFDEGTKQIRIVRVWMDGELVYSS
jgi:N-acetylglucosamine-6-phosphate deacetylase